MTILDRVENAALPRLEYQDVSVDYGATRALDAINISVAPGEIVGLLGHNGAGKSTLFNVTSGAARPTAGRILLDGARIDQALSPAVAAEHGITVIHQEPALAPNLSVYENLVLGRHDRGRRADKRARAAEAIAAVGLNLPLDVKVSALDIGPRQLVELARGVYGGATKLLLLDEPTAALGRAETDSLHRLIVRFAEAGAAVMYVSHRLPDILDVCTRIVVLRGGSVVVDGPATDFTAARLADALIPGIELPEFVPGRPGALALSALSSRLAVYSGEVVGLFGMAGGEHFRIVESIVGVAAPGQPIVLHGRPLTLRGPADAINHGVTFVPGDRERDGLLSGRPALDNVMLPWFRRAAGKGWWVSDHTGQDIYQRARDDLDIRGPGGSAAIDQFSGGNRQKHLLARWLYPHSPDIVLLSQPTQGVDVGARRDIVRVIRQAASDGAAIVVASAESDELASLCDRAYVLLGGRVVEVQRSDHFDEDLLQTLLALADDIKNLEEGDAA